MNKASPKRVLFLAKYLDSGGVTTHMMTLALGLREAGWEVGIISAGTQGNHELGPHWFASAGIAHFVVPYDSRNPLTLIRNAARTLRIVREFQPGILHVHWRITSTYAKVVESVLGIPFVSTLHLLGIGESRFHRLFSYWGKRAIAISSECRTYLEDAFRLSPDTIDLIFNGADASYFHLPHPEEREEARRSYNILDDTCVISLTGRLEEVKGHKLLLEALKPLLKDDAKISVLFAGEGSLHDELVDQVTQLGIERRISFLGHTNARQVLWASDISVLPSFNEGFPLSTVESMLCGVTTVRSQTSGAHDVILDGDTGFIVPIGDVDILRMRLEQLISDKALRTAMSHRAHERALELFTSNRMTQLTIQTYEKALSQ